MAGRGGGRGMNMGGRGGWQPFNGPEPGFMGDMGPGQDMRMDQMGPGPGMNMGPGPGMSMGSGPGMNMGPGPGMNMGPEMGGMGGDMREMEPQFHGGRGGGRRGGRRGGGRMGGRHMDEPHYMRGRKPPGEHGMLEDQLQGGLMGPGPGNRPFGGPFGEFEPPGGNRPFGAPFDFEPQGGNRPFGAPFEFEPQGGNRPFGAPFDFEPPGGGGFPPGPGPRPGPPEQFPRGPPAAAVNKSNDYCQHFVDTGARPQNFLRDASMSDRYEEYPKLKELVARKIEHVRKHNTPAFFMKADLKVVRLAPEIFGTKFDVVLVDPPWEEYARRAPGLLRDPETWTWEEIRALEIEKITDTPSFVFLWCGTAEGLEAGRHCLTKWGFKRCEDIVWLKTNQEAANRKYLSATNQERASILTHTKEHCLMGIKGSVKRKVDGHIIHTNCDTDVIVSEEPPMGSTIKPEELYEIIERFSQGRRRLELFGEDHNVRPGWVTMGRSLSTSNFNASVYSSNFRLPDGSVFFESNQQRVPRGAPNLLPADEQVEELRPRSPPQGGQGKR